MVSKFLAEYSYFLLFLILVVVIFGLLHSLLMVEVSHHELELITVQEGDTLWGIAQNYHQQLNLPIQDYIDTLQSINELEQTMLYPGQQLQVMIADSSF